MSIFSTEFFAMEIFAFIYATLLVFLSVILVATPFLICSWNGKKPPVPPHFALYIFGILGSLMLLPFISDAAIKKELSGLAFTIAGIIGASIPILFSFSVFILQNAAEVFSIKYLSDFADNSKERMILGMMVFLATISVSVPFVFDDSPKTALFGLLFILLSAFLLIYQLYIELQENIKSQRVFKNIKENAIKNLEKIKDLYALIPNQNPENTAIGIDNPALEHIKCLHGIGLRFLDRKEIYAVNEAMQCISEIYFKHLDLGSGHFVKNQNNLAGFSDYQYLGIQSFTCLQSLGDRIVREFGKESIYFLLNVYAKVINHTLDIKYSDGRGSNPLLSRAMSDYISHVKKTLAKEKSDLNMGAISSLAGVSYIILEKAEGHDVWYVSEDIHSTMDEFFEKWLPKLSEGRIVCLIFLAFICFRQMAIACDKHKNNTIFWESVFKILEKSILAIPKQSEDEPSKNYLSEKLFDCFSGEQDRLASNVLRGDYENVQGKSLSNFIALLEKQGGFFLSFARRNKDKYVTDFIFKSVAYNLNIIHQIKCKFSESVLDGIHETHIKVLSACSDSTDDSKILKHNLRFSLGILQECISRNLEHKVFDADYLETRFTRLIEEYLKHTKHELPEVIDVLSNLVEIFKRDGKTKEEEGIRSKIAEINKKYSSEK